MRKLTFLKLLPLAMAGFLGLTACGDDSGGTPDGGPGAADASGADATPHELDYPEFARRVAVIQCQSIVECHPQVELADCIAENPPQKVADVMARLASGALVFHKDAAEACLAARSPLQCDYDSINWDTPPQSEACNKVLEGHLAAGAACAFEDECSSEVCDVTECNANNTCCVGTCRDYTPPILPTLGEACGVNGACEFPNICLESTTTCGQRPQEGEACPFLFSCDRGLLCRPTSPDSVVGICEHWAGPGEACVVDAIAPCVRRDNVCDPVTLTCVPDGGPDDTISHPGDACTSDDQCEASLCTNHVCTVPAPPPACPIP